MVDLNPGEGYNGLGDGQFPIQFASVDDPNLEVYKTTKLVLTRVPDLSEASSATFEMGGHASDHDGAVDDHATVTLGNGGSTQRDLTIRSLDSQVKPLKFHEILDETTGLQRYPKDTHLFVDPFQLTVAQWCYVEYVAKGDRSSHEAAKAAAMEGLEDRYETLARSWYAYRNAFELKDGESPLTEQEVEDRVKAHEYDPLEDTRPWHLSSYREVRGTPQVFTKTRGTNGGQYLSSGSVGDEYRLRDHGGTSFLDLLNQKVALRTRKRTMVEDPVDGGQRLDQTAYATAPTNWFTGASAGLNFDLPTEAQWEWCCRQGTTNAMPNGSNLGSLVDGPSSELDLVAWYRYATENQVPQPERFAAWRVSRLWFGIDQSDDSIQIPNPHWKA